MLYKARPLFGIMRPRFAAWCPPIAHRQEASLASLLRQQNAFMNRFFFDVDSEFASPGYQVTNTKDTMKISIDVPGMKAADIDINIEDGDVLTLKGVRETDTSKYNFRQSFTLDPSVEIDKVTASLKNGVLEVSAPKDPAMMEETIKKIPIQEIAETNEPADVEAQDVDVKQAVDDEKKAA